MYNKHKTKIVNQQGGTAVIAREQLGHKRYERLYDKLGRWMMMSFCGKDDMALRVVSGNPLRESYNDITLLKYLRQANLDAVWGRASNCKV